MGFKDPHKVYTAETNVEAHLVVKMLESNGIEGAVEEDQSGVSLWMLGPLSQFHQPNVWVEAVNADAASKLLEEFERRKQERANQSDQAGDVQVTCEECGAVSAFAAQLVGTTQDCSHCGAYVDVGDLPWDDEWEKD